MSGSELESYVERKFGRWMIEEFGIKNPVSENPDVLSVKTTRRGFPDRTFWLPDRQVEIIEFKREGEEPTALQARHIEWLRQMGHVVHVVAGIEEARELFYEIRTNKRRRG